MKLFLFFFLSLAFSKENALSFSSSEFGTAKKFIHHLAKSLLENQPRLKSDSESSYISSQSFIDNIFDYGCWCQFSEELLKFRRGPGNFHSPDMNLKFFKKAKDVIDRQCQNWYRCTKCIRIDSFGSCLPESKNYHVTLNFLTGRYECSFDSDAGVGGDKMKKLQIVAFVAIL